MTTHADFIDRILEKSEAIVTDLAADKMIGRYIDASLSPPRPYVGIGPIRLIVIGQDPTVKNVKTRAGVTTVLTLNQRNSNLYRRVERICAGLGFSLEQNVYATNVCKNFFTELPEGVKDPDLIGLSWLKWRSLLHEELARFPDAAIVTLGEPVLQALVRPPHSQKLRHYWGHVQGWETDGLRDFRHVGAEESAVGRRFFPLPHATNSSAIKLYRTQFDRYLSFIQATLGKDVA